MYGLTKDTAQLRFAPYLMIVASKVNKNKVSAGFFAFIQVLQELILCNGCWVLIPWRWVCCMPGHIVLYRNHRACNNHGTISKLDSKADSDGQKNSIEEQLCKGSRQSVVFK